MVERQGACGMTSLKPRVAFYEGGLLAAWTAQAQSFLLLNLSLDGLLLVALLLIMSHLANCVCPS